MFARSGTSIRKHAARNLPKYMPLGKKKKKAEALGATAPEGNWIITKVLMSRVRTRPLLSSSFVSVTQESLAFREVRVSRESHDASRPISTGIETHGTTVRFTVKQSFRRAANRSDFQRTECCEGTSQIHIGRALDIPAQINFNSTASHKGRTVEH